MSELFPSSLLGFVTRNRETHDLLFTVDVSRELFDYIRHSDFYIGPGEMVRLSVIEGEGMSALSYGPGLYLFDVLVEDRYVEGGEMFRQGVILNPVTVFELRPEHVPFENQIIF